MLCHGWLVALTGVMVAELSVRPDLIHKLVPPHCEEALRLRSIDINNFKPIPLEQLRITLD
jgi:glycogen synthase kinase 3 beta